MAEQCFDPECQEYVQGVRAEVERLREDSCAAWAEVVIRNSQIEHLQAEVARLTQLVGHRACLGVEHDPENGKIHGLCVICGVPFPCDLISRDAEVSRLTQERDELKQVIENQLHGVPRPDWSGTNTVEIIQEDELIRRTRERDEARGK